MNNGDYIPTLDDMVEEDYRDKIIKILNDTLVGYINDEKTYLIQNCSDYNDTNSIITYRKIRDKDGKLIKIIDPVVITTEYEERETTTLFKQYMFINTPEKIKVRDIKNGITIRLPFCKVELCLSGKPDNSYVIEKFLDVIVTSSDNRDKEFHSVNIEEISGNNYDPKEYSATRGGEYDWQFRFINSLFDKTRDIIKNHYKDNKYKIELYDRIFKSISLSVLYIFKVIRYKLYKEN